MKFDPSIRMSGIQMIRSNLAVNSKVLESPTIDAPVLVNGLGVRFFNTMESYKDKIHHVDATSGVTETKNSVMVRAMKVATVMRQRGIKEGSIVIIASKVHPDQTIALLACLFVGVIIAPLHVDLGFDETKRLVKILQPKLAFCGTRSARMIQKVFHDLNYRCTIFCFHDMTKDFLYFMKCFDVKIEPNFALGQIKDPKRTACFIMCTLGTESPPKLVSISHYALLIRFSRFLKLFKRPEKLISFFPLSCTMHMLASCVCFDSQMKLIYLRQYTEKSICKYIQEYRIEYVFLDGELAVRIVKNGQVPEFDLGCLKGVYISGMPLSTTNFARVTKTFKSVNINTTYQTVETGMITNVTEDVFSRKREKVLSVGKIYAGISVRVIDPNTGQTVGIDKYGEVQVKTTAMMQGYYRNAQLTSRAFSKGYFKTGDLGCYDRDGYIYIKGRLTDNIVRGDNIFSAADIEEVIKLHPFVSEVVCFDAQNELVVCIVTKKGRQLSSSEVIDYISGVLPPYKIPTKVYFQQFFPKNVLGVIKKYCVREAVTKVFEKDSVMENIDSTAYIN